MRIPSLYRRPSVKAVTILLIHLAQVTVTAQFMEGYLWGLYFAFTSLLALLAVVALALKVDEEYSGGWREEEKVKATLKQENASVESNVIIRLDPSRVIFHRDAYGNIAWVGVTLETLKPYLTLFHVETARQYQPMPQQQVLVIERRRKTLSDLLS